MSNSGSQPKYKVGDTVYDYKMRPCHVMSVYSWYTYGYWCYKLAYDNGVTTSISEVDLDRDYSTASMYATLPINVQPKYKLGDVLHNKHNGTVALITSIPGYPGSDMYELISDTGGVLSLYEAELDQDYVFGTPLNFSISKVHQDLKKLYDIEFNPGFYYGDYTISKHTGCDHNFVEYQGLFECYDYCTKCNKKRGEA